jgi:fluoride exporter
MNYLLTFIGGGIGAAGRYWLSGFVYRFLDPLFPYGNLFVNVSGCFLIGFCMTFFEERFIVNPSLRVFLTVGVLGGFTTFSSFSYETMVLFKAGQSLLAFLNIFASLLLCLLGTYLGMMLGKLL